MVFPMRANLVLRQSRRYAAAGVGLGGAVLKHSLFPLGFLDRVLPERGTMLDLGCGDGMLGNLTAALRPGLRVRGVDLDAHKVALANRNAPSNARYETGDILRQSFAGASAAVFNDVLHHHGNDLQAELLVKAFSFLEPGGVLLVKEVDAADSADRTWTTFWDRRLYPGDALRFRDVAGWREALFQSGFEILEIFRVRHPWPASRTLFVCRRPAQEVSLPMIESRQRVKVVLTGGTGFIGSHLARRLCRQGLDGSAVELVLLTRDPSRLSPNLAKVCRILVGDLASRALAEELRDCHYVFHLAADKDFFGGKSVFVNNVKGTEALLAALQGATHLRRLVFASSMGAVDRLPADPCTSLLNEDSEPHPASAYGRAKLECERLIARSSLPHAILRLPWVYGPEIRPGTHARRLTEMVMAGRLAVRFGWPGRVSLLDVKEAARAFCFAAMDPGMLGKTLFVSDGEPIRMGKLFEEMGYLTGRKAGRIPVPAVVRHAARRLRRFLPLTLRSLFLDVLAVDNGRLRDLGFAVAPRPKLFLLPLVRYLSDQAYPAAWRSETLVTGAASGIGYALAVQSAACGRGVILVDRDARAQALAEEIPGATCCVADLGQRAGLERVRRLIESDRVNRVINCAGIGIRVPVGEGDAELPAALLALNVGAVTELSEYAMKSFRAAGEGILVNMASSAAFQPLPGMAAYAASKAYVLSFSEAIAGENDTAGIAVLAVCPGGTATRFQESSGVQNLLGERLLRPEAVAGAILAACRRRRSGTLVIGAQAASMSLLARLLPRPIAIRLWKRLMDARRPGVSNDQ